MLHLSIRELPASVTAANQELSVSADFRDWIRADLIMRDTQIPEEAKLPLLCQYIGLDIASYQGDAMDLWAGIFSFYTCQQQARPETGGTSKEIAYRFDYDWWLIYAAFKQQYNINLLTAELHWFEFKALLDGLGEETQFVKVVQARLRDTSKLKGEEKQQAERLKRYWRVPSEEAETERDPHEIEAELLAKLQD